MDFAVTSRSRASQSRTFFVPLEILRTILEEVEPRVEFRKYDILSSSLVCKTWLHEARPILFRHIGVTFDEPEVHHYNRDGIAWVTDEIDGEEPGPGRQHRSAASFLGFLQTHKAISRHIRYLQLARTVSRTKAGDIDGDELVQILQSLPGLRSLTMENLLLSASPTQAGSLLGLRIHHLSVRPPRRSPDSNDGLLCDILAILNLFNEVEELQLDAISGCTVIAPHSQVPTHLRLKKISLFDVEDSPGLLSAFSQMTDPDSSDVVCPLRWLEVELHSVGDASIFLHLFSRALQDVYHLGIKLGGLDTDHDNRELGSRMSIF